MSSSLSLDDSEDVESEQVKKLAAALAPQLHELESLMDDPLLRSEHNSNKGLQSQVSQISKVIVSDDEESVSGNGATTTAAAAQKIHPQNSTGTAYDSDDSEFGDMNLDDDDMDQELEQLAFAEDILRRELDLAKDFASFFGSSPMAMPPQDDSKSFTLNLNFSTAATAAAAALKPANLFQSSSNSNQQQQTPTLTQQDEPVFDEDDHDLQEEEDGKDISSMNMDGSSFLENVEEAVKKPPEETLHFEGTTGTTTTIEPAALVTGKEKQPNNTTQEQDTQKSPTPTTTTASVADNNNATTTTLSSNNYQYKLQTPSPSERRKRASISNPTLPETPQTSVVLFKAPASTYTSTEHFQSLQLRKEPQGAWYSVDLTNHMILHNNNNNNNNSTNQVMETGITAGMGIKEYCLSITQWKRLFVGLRLEGDEERQLQRKQQKQQQKQKQSSTPTEATTTPNNHNQGEGEADPTAKRAPVRTISIRIRPDVLCGAVMDAVTQTLLNDSMDLNASIIKRQGGHLQATIKGQVPNTAGFDAHHHHHHTPTTPRRSSISSAFKTNNSANNNNKPRDCTFLVDVQLCTHKSDQCERVLLLRVFHWGNEADGSGRMTVPAEDMWSPSSTRSIRSSTTASPNKVNDPPLATTATTTTPQQHPGEDPLLVIAEGDFGDASTLASESKIDQQHRANFHLREACALIQRIESPELARKIRPLVRKSVSNAEVNEDLRDAVTDHLLHNYRACPSVLQPDTTITLPALSPQDWPVIQAAWSWIHSVWDELETRELTYLSFLPMSSPMTTTITTATPPSSPSAQEAAADAMLSAPPVPRFGAFPALPTLDVQYCSQLRRLSREAMIGQLLKAASVLEDYARQAEYQCANLIDLLRPTFAYYQIETPSLPKPAPLASYPLEYTPPQSLCPPWGMKVMEALNQVAAMSHEAGENPAEKESSSTGLSEDAMSRSIDSIALAETAVQMVYASFQQQDDEEHSARLARKNLQVMDRLTKMQEHNRSSIRALGAASTDTASAAADDFFSKAENAIIGLLSVRRSGSEEKIDFHTKPWREVPLVKWTVGFGGSSGTCTITPNQILFTPTKLIPLLGYSQSTWFNLADVEFDITQTPATLLNPLTTTLKLLESSTGVEAYNFKPSSAGPRLKSFLDIVQKEACATQRG